MYSGVLLKYRHQCTANQWTTAWPPCVLCFRPSDTLKESFLSPSSYNRICWHSRRNSVKCTELIFQHFFPLHAWTVYHLRVSFMYVGPSNMTWVISLAIESPSSHPGFHDCNLGWLVSNVTNFVFMVNLEVGVWLMSQTSISRDDLTSFVSGVKTPQTEESRDRLWIHWTGSKKRSWTKKLQEYWIYWKCIGNIRKRHHLPHENIMKFLINNKFIDKLRRIYTRAHTHTHWLIQHWKTVVACFCGKLALGV